MEKTAQTDNWISAAVCSKQQIFWGKKCDVKEYDSVKEDFQA